MMTIIMNDGHIISTIVTNDIVYYQRSLQKPKKNC